MYDVIQYKKSVTLKIVYNKKKIQMFFVKYVFYFTQEVDNNYISFVALPLIKYKYCPLHSWNKIRI